MVTLTYFDDGSITSDWGKQEVDDHQYNRPKMYPHPYPFHPTLERSKFTFEKELKKNGAYNENVFYLSWSGDWFLPDYSKPGIHIHVGPNYDENFLREANISLKIETQVNPMWNERVRPIVIEPCFETEFQTLLPIPDDFLEIREPNTSL